VTEEGDNPGASLAGMGADDGLPQLTFPSAAEWEAWLEANHNSSEGVWLKIAKKGSGIASVTRRLLPTALHAAAPEQQVVADQRREGREADRRGTDAAGRAR
jgi:hypothetical protein